MTTESPKALLKTTLEDLGLTKYEVAVYLANLELGSAPASKIAQKAKVNRITAYEALRRLSRRGLVRIHAKQGKSTKQFDVESVDVLIDKLQQTKEKTDANIDLLRANREALGKTYQHFSSKPDVAFYEGEEGIKTALMDTLKQKPTETLSFASGSSLLAFDESFLQSYYNKRLAMKIPTKGIIPGTDAIKTRYSPEVNRKELRQLKFLDPKLDTLQHEIEIYGDNVAFLSLEQGNEHGIIVRSRTIAAAMREIFTTVWERL